MPTFVYSSLLVLILATPAMAADADCEKAARDHTDFKAVLDNDPSGKPQYETVRHEADHLVEVTHYTGGEKRMVRTSLYGLFLKEYQAILGDKTVRTGVSRSVDPETLMPLKPNTSLQFKNTTATDAKLGAEVADVKVDVGGEREIAIGGCRLQAIDLTIVSRPLGRDLMITTKLAYVPDLAYPVEFNTELVMNGKTTTGTMKVQSIEPWDGKVPASP
ncbi:MAG: hypothetical protein JO366_11905 [Methylobacteriaceae bacterium]|nr:hypothetical protein [Methylobacteriaceae bacterium]MBV9245504.1 hypothetical protein [Methylobacteriaceae bacterium]MBV9635028.1 hypothetical protein [Methylobacteriaceae bacterium]MBV9702863.1 hypothetical protein [Methylobacteriaceae bacterium]